MLRKPAAKEPVPAPENTTTRRLQRQEEIRVSDRSIRIAPFHFRTAGARRIIATRANSDWIEARRQLLAELGEN